MPWLRGRRRHVAQAQLRSGVLKDNDEDAIVVLRTVTQQQGGTGELMSKVLASSSKLDASQRTRAMEAAAAFSKQVLASNALLHVRARNAI